MLVLISPAKKLDFDTPAPIQHSTLPTNLKQQKSLVSFMKKKTQADLKKLMGISDKLSKLNYERFQEFEKQPTKQALFAFAGDTYTGLDSSSLTAKQIEYAQDHLIILSGLYGTLRPLDEIRAYRLEMGTNLQYQKSKQLHQFWEKLNTQYLESIDDKIIVNCASNEYFASINTANLSKKIITPVFKEVKNGVAKIISFNAKKARGMMARYIIQHKVKTVKKLIEFNEAGYQYDKASSNDLQPVFLRA